MDNLIKHIQALVGTSGVLLGAAVSARADSWPPTPAGGCQARAIIRPGSTAEVAAVMQLCHQAGQTVVTHGGLTGLVWGAKATAADIVISLERMRSIEAVDVINRTVTVEAGVPLQMVQQAAEAAGMLFPLDLGARGSATIGGNIATNAGGNSVIRYGMMRDQVLGIEAVLADGTVISSLNTVIKNNTGYDLRQWFIGSEGTLGIVTRAVLRLRPLPRSRNTALVAVRQFADVGRLLQVVDASLGGTLSAFEVMWNDFYALITGRNERHGQPLAATHAFYVLLEATGSHQDIDRSSFERALEEAFKAELIVDAVIAHSQQQRQALWAIRDDIDTMVRALYPPITFDVSLSISAMDEYIEEVRRTLAERLPGSQMVVFGHIGDGNLHLVIGAGNLDPATVHTVENTVYQTLQRHHGVISAEHGIGLQKREHLGISRSAAEIALMRMIKQAMDPKGLLNPGKIFLPEGAQSS